MVILLVLEFCFAFFFFIKKKKKPDGKSIVTSSNETPQEFNIKQHISGDALVSIMTTSRFLHWCIQENETADNFTINIIQSLLNKPVKPKSFPYSTKYFNQHQSLLVSL